MTTVNTTALTVKPPTTTTPPRLRNLRTRSVCGGGVSEAGRDGFRSRHQEGRMVVWRKSDSERKGGGTVVVRKTGRDAWRERI